MSRHLVTFLSVEDLSSAVTKHLMSLDNTQVIHKASAGAFSSRYKGRKVLMQSHYYILNMRPSDIYTPHRVEATKSLTPASPNRSSIPNRAYSSSDGSSSPSGVYFYESAKSSSKAELFPRRVILKKSLSPTEYSQMERSKSTAYSSSFTIPSGSRRTTVFYNSQEFNS